MSATRISTSHSAVKVLLAVVGLAILAAGTGCDVYGLGGYSPLGLIGDTLGYRNDVMDWSAQAWSDVILYDDYIPYDTWDAYDMTYPWY